MPTSQPDANHDGQCLSRGTEQLNIMTRQTNLIALTAALCFLPAIAAAQVDDDAAMALAKKSGCFKCHAVDKRKKSPSYKDVAAKFKGNPNAEREVFFHITGNPIVKPENDDEKHIAPDSKDETAIINLVLWILTR